MAVVKGISAFLGVTIVLSILLFIAISLLAWSGSCRRALYLAEHLPTLPWSSREAVGDYLITLCRYDCIPVPTARVFRFCHNERTAKGFDVMEEAFLLNINTGKLKVPITQLKLNVTPGTWRSGPEPVYSYLGSLDSDADGLSRSGTLGASPGTWQAFYELPDNDRSTLALGSQKVIRIHFYGQNIASPGAENCGNVSELTRVIATIVPKSGLPHTEEIVVENDWLDSNHALSDSEFGRYIRGQRQGAKNNTNSRRDDPAQVTTGWHHFPDDFPDERTNYLIPNVTKCVRWTLCKHDGTFERTE
jgi:hypothetical protein